jgi:uncharacterized repeat protein (TIGR03943 family)
MALTFIFFPANAACCDAANCGHPISRSSLGKWLSFLILVVPVVSVALVRPTQFSQTAIVNRGVITDGSVISERLAARAASKEGALPLPTKDASAQQAPSLWPDAPSTPVGSTAAPNTIPPGSLPTAGANPSAAPAPGAAPAAPASLSSPAPASTAAAPSAPNDYLQRTPDGHIIAEVLDLLYAAQDNTLRKDFEGKTVELIGQMMPDATNNAKGNRFKAVRMFMTCCAADARPVATLVESGSPAAFPEMTWIKITGTATFPIENGRRTAVLKAEKVEKTEPPSETMLY